MVGDEPDNGLGVALVTGASQGIGRSIAVRMGAAGWRVVLASRNETALHETAALVAARGGTADVRVVDVADPAAVTALVDGLTDDGIRIDTLVNNSGIAGPSGPLWEIDPADWDETFAVNVRGVYLLCRAVLPAMIERRHGAIVTIGSVTGKNPLVHRTAYATSKAALIGLTRTLAADAGPYGVRVNLVSPGAVGGDRLERVLAAQAEATRTHIDEVRAAASAQSVLRRVTDPDEVADAVVFLASPAASGITGIDLSVAAGFVMN